MAGKKTKEYDDGFQTVKAHGRASRVQAGSGWFATSNNTLIQARKRLRDEQKTERRQLYRDQRK